MTISTHDIASSATPSRRIDADAFYSTAETSHITGVKERTLEHWRTTGAGPSFVRFGDKLVKYRGADLLAFAAERTFKSTSEETAHAA